VVSEFLSKGKENARTGRELATLLNITMRELTQAIERERRDGQPICASTGNNPGYYLAASKEEMEDYCGSLKRRMGEIYKTRRACVKMIKELPGELEGAENGKAEYENREQRGNNSRSASAWNH